MTTMLFKLSEQWGLERDINYSARNFATRVSFGTVHNGNHGNGIRISVGLPESCTANKHQSGALEQWWSTERQKRS